METTKSFIRVYDISPEVAEQFQDEYTCTELATVLVPQADHDDDAWGVSDAEDYDYEYSHHQARMEFALETKWAVPVEWLTSASARTPQFRDKVLAMTTIQKDETVVTGVVVKNGEVLTNNPIFQLTLEEVHAHYEDESGEAIDELDSNIWGSIEEFLATCEKAYT